MILMMMITMTITMTMTMNQDKPYLPTRIWMWNSPTIPKIPFISFGKSGQWLKAQCTAYQYVVLAP